MILEFLAPDIAFVFDFVRKLHSGIGHTGWAILVLTVLRKRRHQAAHREW
jgi:hypothetical protein